MCRNSHPVQTSPFVVLLFAVITAIAVAHLLERATAPRPFPTNVISAELTDAHIERELALQDQQLEAMGNLPLNAQERCQYRAMKAGTDLATCIK